MFLNNRNHVCPQPVCLFLLLLFGLHTCYLQIMLIVDAVHTHTHAHTHLLESMFLKIDKPNVTSHKISTLKI